MSSKKKEIGKGIRALLANIESDNTVTKKDNLDSDTGSTTEVDIKAIEANPFQPRTEFDEEKLNELKESIATFGVIQPITLRRLNNKRYQIISGERRWRASQLAGLKKIPAYIREADDQGMLEMALLENIQRADLNPLEVSISYQRLIDECDLTHEELSTRLGKKRSSISNYLRILKLSPSAQKALKLGHISMGHAKVLAGIDRIESQVDILNQILESGLSVRATEALLNRNGKANSSKSEKATKNQTIDPEIKKYQDKLSDKLGSKVAISRGQNGKGTVKINFGSDDELNDIFEELLK